MSRLQHEDSDDSLSTDEEVEVPQSEDEVDYVQEQARRQQEHMQLQKGSAARTKPNATSPSAARRVDPYDMLPLRYKDSRPSTAGTASLSDFTVTFNQSTNSTAIVAADKKHEHLEPDVALRRKTEHLLEEAEQALRHGTPEPAPASPSSSPSPASAPVTAPAPVQPQDANTTVTAVEANEAQEKKEHYGPYEDDAMDITEELLSGFTPGMFANMLEREATNSSKVYQPAHAGKNVWADALSADAKFDLVQSVLEEMVESDKKFLRLQKTFKDKHCETFEDKDENKLEYTVIHNAWVEAIEKYLTKRLRKNIPGFDMDDFMEILQERSEEVSGEVWCLLHSFTDFQLFKDNMLAHKYGDMSEPTEVELSRTELAGVIDEAQKVMDFHFVRAQKEKEARLAEEAVQNAGLRVPALR